MKVNDHQNKHIKLHAALDELLADYMRHTGEGIKDLQVLRLAEWSVGQTQVPTERDSLLSLVKKETTNG